MCVSQQVDGIVLIPVDTDCIYYNKIHENGTPIVICTRPREDWKYDGVYVDNVALCRMAWNHMYDNGYRRIALLSDYKILGSSKILREEAFIHFAAEKMEMDGNSLIFRVETSPELIRKALEAMKNRYPDEKKAVFAIDTNLLFLTLRELNGLNMRIPQDFGICGYDLLGWSELTPPGITILIQPFYELGLAAGRQILRRAGDFPSAPPEEIWLKGRLEVRKSTAAY
jgi:LacI family kdg operon repressor